MMAGIPRTAFDAYLQTFLRRKITFLAVFAVCAVGTGLLTFTVKPAYKTTSRVAIADIKEMRTPDFFDVYLPGANTIALAGDTYVALLEGLPMAEKIASRLGEEGIFLDGKRVAHCLKAEYYEPDMIEITAQAGDSVRSIAVANAAAEVFVTENRESIRRELGRAVEFMEEEMASAEQEWLDIQSQIVRFRSTVGITDLDTYAATLMGRVAEYEQDIDRNEVELTAMQARRGQLESLLGSASVARLNPMEDGTIQQLYKKLGEVEAEAAVTRGEYAADHQKVRLVEAKRDELLREIQQRADQILKEPQPVRDEVYYSDLRRDLAQIVASTAGTEAHLKTMRTVLAGVNRELLEIPQQQMEFQHLKLQRSASEEKLRTLMEVLQKARVQVGGAQGNAAVIDLAVDARPTTRQGQLLAYAVILSLLLGVGAVFVMEYLDDTLKTSDEVTRLVELTLLGAIPRVKDIEQRLLSPDDQRSPLFESYRILRSGVRFASVNNPVRSLLVTSSLPGEGKSSTAVNLGIVMAAGGQRVLLVDADLRNPALHRLLGIEPRAGMTSVLLGEARLGEVILPTPYERLSLLPSGPVPPNPVELFESQGMKELVSELEGMADLVVFDSAPALPVTDAALLAGLTDAVIVVLAAGQVTADESLSTKRILGNVGARVIGGVLNKVRGVSLDGYYGRYPYSEDGPQGAAPGKGRWRKAIDDLMVRSGSREE